MQKSLLSSLCFEALVLPINKEVVKHKLCNLHAKSVVTFHIFIRLNLRKSSVEELLRAKKAQKSIFYEIDNVV